MSPAILPLALLIDQNLPRVLESFLERDLPGCRHVRSPGLEQATDSMLWSEARTRGLAILTKDLDFRHRSAVFGHPPKIVLVRSGNCSTAVVCGVIAGSLPTIRAFLSDPSAPLLAIG
jgi:predicted nuclease of predicted toxin-antitoxin system